MTDLILQRFISITDLQLSFTFRILQNTHLTRLRIRQSQESSQQHWKRL